MNNQAAQTMPERAYMTRDEALKIARACAYAKCHTHDYLPRTAQEAADWQPHEWALDAIRWNALSQTAGVVEGKRDREADRLRFPDADFNAWLDAGISDAGHTVYDSISSIEDAWQGWHGHVLSVMLDENPGLDAMLAEAPAARVDDRVQRLIDEARRCAGSTGDLSDLRAALMPFEGDY